MKNRPKPVMLIILDGWGINPETVGNALSQAATPRLDELISEYPHTQLVCSGKDVGLPDGIMGNSEVGHLNIGAGRIVYQDLLRIDTAIADGSFYKNDALVQLMDSLAGSDNSLHLMGLVSDGGVHSQLTHLLALLDMARQKGLDHVKVHAILDGRDTAPDGGVGYLQQVQDHIDENGLGQIVTVCGRYYAMDRDQRWDRTEKAYRLLARGDGRSEDDPVEAARNAYDRGETDEFVKPICLREAGGGAYEGIRDGDGIIFFNFRADRARQITRAFTETDFDGFERDRPPRLEGFVCMTEYDEKFDLPVAFEPLHLEKILGELISLQELRQLRIAETEKYAHVTYFFNGGEETPFAGEDRKLIPSPREVATYDQKPEMSAPEVTHEVLERLRTDQYDFIVLNFANMDMVGHTGVIEAAVKACETVDTCVGRIVDRIRSRNGVAIITADHGNAELMRNPEGGLHTAHTRNPVPLILVDDSRKGARLNSGRLGDIAPTILDIMDIEQPDEMTGTSLLADPD